MNNLEARIILEKLFEGVHPETGEVFAEDHVCNEAQVLRALHRAIVALNSQPVAAERQRRPGKVMRTAKRRGRRRRTPICATPAGRKFRSTKSAGSWGEARRAFGIV